MLEKVECLYFFKCNKEKVPRTQEKRNLSGEYGWRKLSRVKVTSLWKEIEHSDQLETQLYWPTTMWDSFANIFEWKEPGVITEGKGDQSMSPSSCLCPNYSFLPLSPPLYPYCVIWTKTRKVIVLPSGTTKSYLLASRPPIHTNWYKYMDILASKISPGKCTV